MLQSFPATCFDSRIENHHQDDKAQGDSCNVHHFKHFTLSLYTVRISTYRIIKVYNNMIR